MSSHWTYTDEAPDAQEDLQQGDFLVPTDELRTVLSDVHPHFCHDKYLGFLVISQTCDLFRRKGNRPAKANYINIAVVRPLGQVLLKLLDLEKSAVAPGVFRRSNRDDCRKLLTRVFNQNEQALGIFYLHPEQSVGIGEPSVALLRVSVALRWDHYPILQRGRRGRLSEEFQARLGWLVGNLFGRPAARDWSQSPESDQMLQDMLRGHLDDPDNALGPTWVDDRSVEAATKAGVEFANRTPREVLEDLETNRPPTSIETAIKAVLKDVRAVIGSMVMTNPKRPPISWEVDEAAVEWLIERLSSRLRNNGLLKTALKTDSDS